MKKRYEKQVICEEASFIPAIFSGDGKGKRGFQYNGILFERLVGRHLWSIFGEQVLSNVWFSYMDKYQGEGVCSTDHLIVDMVGGVVTIVECKLTHTPTAWKQLNNLYRPVVERAFPGFKVRGLEVCKNFERACEYPVKAILVHGWDDNFEGFDNVMVYHG